MSNKVKIYLDDVRTPVKLYEWLVVRSYDEFIKAVEDVGFENIDFVSLDHDLGDSAIKEYHNSKDREINYDNITEKTGMDVAKWLVDQWLDGKPQFNVRIHSHNSVGARNMESYINNYLKKDPKSFSIAFLFKTQTRDDNNR